MSTSTITPNMNLIVPTPGQELGPQYAYDINTSLTLLDQHDHTPGRGVQITPSGLNINSQLTFNLNPATNVSYVNLGPQSVTPGVNSIYESGVDLYYVDGIGNNIRITQSGAVAGTPGSIANLVAPASATYVAGSSTFVWQSNTNIAANLDAGSILLRNLSPNSTYALTLSPPTGLSNNYGITLPTLPSVQSIMTLSPSGQMAAPYTVDNSTIIISSNVIEVAPLGITAAQIANQTITAAQIAPGTITPSQISNPGLSINPNHVNYAVAGSYTWTVPAGVTRVIIQAVGGGGGGQGNGTGPATTGGNTTFNGGIVAMGAPGGGNVAGGAGGYSYADFYFGGNTGNQGMNSNTNLGGAVGSGGGGGGGGASTFNVGGQGGNTSGSAGSNGLNGSGGGGGNGGAGGSGGKATITILDGLTPGSSIPIVVGGGGTPSVGSTAGGFGGDGFITIYF